MYCWEKQVHTGRHLLYAGVGEQTLWLCFVWLCWGLRDPSVWGCACCWLLSQLSPTGEGRQGSGHLWVLQGGKRKHLFGPPLADKGEELEDFQRNPINLKNEAMFVCLTYTVNEKQYYQQKLSKSQSCQPPLGTEANHVLMVLLFALHAKTPLWRSGVLRSQKPVLKLWWCNRHAHRTPIFVVNKIMMWTHSYVQVPLTAWHKWHDAYPQLLQVR